MAPCGRRGSPRTRTSRRAGFAYYIILYYIILFKISRLAAEGAALELVDLDGPRRPGEGAHRAPLRLPQLLMYGPKKLQKLQRAPNCKEGLPLLCSGGRRPPTECVRVWVRARARACACQDRPGECAHRAPLRLPQDGALTLWPTCFDTYNIYIYIIIFEGKNPIFSTCKMCMKICCIRRGRSRAASREVEETDGMCVCVGACVRACVCVSGSA